MKDKDVLLKVLRMEDHKIGVTMDKEAFDDLIRVFFDFAVDNEDFRNIVLSTSTMLIANVCEGFEKLREDFIKGIDLARSRVINEKISNEFPLIYPKNNYKS